MTLTPDQAALRAFRETQIVIALAAVAAWLITGTVTPANCDGQNAQPGVLVWMAVIALGLVGPVFGGQRAYRSGSRGWRNAAVVGAGVVVAAIVLLAVLVVRVGLIDCA